MFKLTSWRCAQSIHPRYLPEDIEYPGAQSLQVHSFQRGGHRRESGRSFWSLPLVVSSLSSGLQNSPTS
jgi:hypothetical protein